MKKVMMPKGFYATPAEDNWNFYRPDGGIMFELPAEWAEWFCKSMNSQGEDFEKLQEKLSDLKEAIIQTLGWQVEKKLLKEKLRSSTRKLEWICEYGRFAGGAECAKEAAETLAVIKSSE